MLRDLHRNWSFGRWGALSEVTFISQDFGVQAKVVAVHPGPVVTRFELQLAAGTKVSKIVGLVKDLAR